jgi:hypothetical protein
LVLEKKKPLTLRYYIVRSRGADDDDVFDPAVVEQMFRLGTAYRRIDSACRRRKRDWASY